MKEPFAPNATLVLIDVQRAIDDSAWARWGGRNNPDAEANIARLLRAWRATDRPIVHVRHESRDPQSTYRPGQPGAEFKPEAAPAPGERIVVKHTLNAFIGTGLERELRAAGVRTLVIVGVITNNSVEATARMAGDLGFETWVVSDATATFARPDYSGRLRTAQEVHAMSLANLEGEYARIASTYEVLERLAPATPDSN
jgi:nicotinamidase-related amidase